MSRPTGAAVAGNAAAKAVVGDISYQQQDCQAFVEGCVRDCGGGMAYRGSNDMFRNVCTWLGTVRDVKALETNLPSALLFIHSKRKRVKSGWNSWGCYLGYNKRQCIYRQIYRNYSKCNKDCGR